MMDKSKLSTGQVMDERYVISGLIGSGGMSHVYLAEDLRLTGKRWAIKESVSTGMFYGDVQAEAELLISLNHPRLPRVVDFYRPDSEGYSYLIMDYIEGVTLSQHMANIQSPLPYEQIIRYASQLLEVLQYLHGHHPPIVYRDLKPSNIMISLQNELVLIDFGIARSYRNGSEEDTVKLGTIGFAAPEQYGGGQSQPVSDLYGLGALLLYMATGGLYSAWQTGMESRLRSRVPAGLIPVIRRLLRHHPEERYQDAASVMLALAPFESEDSPSAYIPLPFERSETSVVAVLGVAPGLGTTHTSFAVSNVLSRSGSTAWVDLCPDSPVHDRIRSMLEVSAAASAVPDHPSPLVWNGIHYWRCPSHENFAELLGGAYQYVVLDMGTGGYEGALEEFTKSDVPVLVVSGADWRLEETLLWLRRSGLKPEPKWKVALPLSGRSSAELLKGALGTEMVFALPLQHDPFQRKGKLADVLLTLLQDITSDWTPRKRVFQKRSY